jgi:hypothetical protein
VIWVEAAAAGMATMPLKKPPAKWAKIRSQRTLDLIEAKIADLQSDAKEKPDWPRRKKIHPKLLRASSLQDWRDNHNQIGDDLGEADAVGDFKRMAECVRKLGGGGVGFCTTQPHRELSAADRAEKWADFAEPKFSPTAEGLCDPLHDLVSAVSRSDDENCELTDKELDICRRALAKAKACGIDENPAELFNEKGELQAALYALVRRIWRGEVVPEEMVRGKFVMVYKGKGSSDDMSKYRCICRLTHAYKVLSAVLLWRLARECEAWLPESQTDFRRFRGCLDNIFIMAEQNGAHRAGACTCWACHRRRCARRCGA